GGGGGACGWCAGARRGRGPWGGGARPAGGGTGWGPAASARPWIARAALVASCWKTIARTSEPNGPFGSRGRWASGPTRATRSARTGSRAATSAIAARIDVRAMLAATLGLPLSYGRAHDLAADHA